jgi:hypothetical protein
MRSPREDDADALARHLGTGHHHHGSRSELAPAEKGRHKRSRALAVVLALGLLRAAQVSYARADETTRALVHLFYQAPAILIAAVWLWGANLFLWRRLRFDPHPLAVFQLEDARAHLTHARVWGVARASSLLYLASLAAFLRLANGAAREEEDSVQTKTPRGLVAAHVVAAATYVAPALALCAPVDRWYPRTRRLLRTTIARCLTPWRRPVSFADFFLADVLCSLAKTLSDAERSACAALAGPAAMFARHRDARFGACGSTSWHVPLVLALPSAIRLAQCLRQARDGGLLAEALRGERAPAAERREGLGSDAKRAARLNALKYFSAFPVVLLSHLKYSVSSETWTATVRPCWVACAAANTAYSLYWDVTHDWDLRLAPALVNECFSFGSRDGRRDVSKNADADRVGDNDVRDHDSVMQRKYLRPRLLYGDPNVYFAAAAADAALRLSWTYKLSSHLRHNAGTVLAFTALEITRRFLWSMFRVEKAYLARYPGTTHGLPR